MKKKTPSLYIMNKTMGENIFSEQSLSIFFIFIFIFKNTFLTRITKVKESVTLLYNFIPRRIGWLQKVLGKRKKKFTALV